MSDDNDAKDRRIAELEAAIARAIELIDTSYEIKAAVELQKVLDAKMK